MPAPTIFQSYHTTGPVIIQAEVGAAFAFANVGVCADGVELEFRTFHREIKPDGAGGPEGGASNYVFLNAMVIAKCKLVPFAGVYVNRLRAMSQANQGGTDGTMTQSGTLYHPGGNLPGVAFASADIDGGFWIRRCMVFAPGNMKASPTESQPLWEFRGIASFDPTTAATILGTVLYSRL